jgi:hypothetical protein
MSDCFARELEIATRHAANNAKEDREFLRWIHDRLKFVHKENENVDFMRRLKKMTEYNKETDDE